ncbi:MAG: hypothetical protein OEY78_00960 [Gammaproteobacteria bacterium]|nr:hypothetical protein [Gammaproteobacteria bacterium]
MLSKLSITLMVLYPVVAYLALWLEKPMLLISYLLFITSLFALNLCMGKRLLAGTALLFFIGLVGYFINQPEIEYLVYLPPTLIFLGLFLLFSQSLRDGETPLITRYAMLLGDKLEQRHLRYNRYLTIVWSIFLLSMAVTSIILALFFSIETWSLFTHVISYSLIAALFIIEFSYRKYHFAGEIEGGFFQFISKIIKIRPANLK